jgi:hypothetical protein
MTPARLPSAVDLLAAIDRSSPLHAFANNMTADELAREESFVRDAMKALVVAATVRDAHDPLLRVHEATLDRVAAASLTRVAHWKPARIERAHIEAALACANLRLAPELLDEALRRAQGDTRPLLVEVERELHRARFAIPQVPTSAAKMPAEEIKRLRDHSVLTATAPPTHPKPGDGDIQSGMQMTGLGALLLLVGTPVAIMGIFGGPALLVAGGLAAAIGLVLVLVGLVTSISGAAKNRS